MNAIDIKDQIDTEGIFLVANKFHQPDESLCTHKVVTTLAGTARRSQQAKGTTEQTYFSEDSIEKLIRSEQYHNMNPYLPPIGMEIETRFGGWSDEAINYFLRMGIPLSEESGEEIDFLEISPMPCFSPYTITHLLLFLAGSGILKTNSNSRYIKSINEPFPPSIHINIGVPEVSEFFGIGGHIWFENSILSWKNQINLVSGITAIAWISEDRLDSKKTCKENYLVPELDQCLDDLGFGKETECITKVSEDMMVNYSRRIEYALPGFDNRDIFTLIPQLYILHSLFTARSIPMDIKKEREIDQLIAEFLVDVSSIIDVESISRGTDSPYSYDRRQDLIFETKSNPNNIKAARTILHRVTQKGKRILYSLA